MSQYYFKIRWYTASVISQPLVTSTSCLYVRDSPIFSIKIVVNDKINLQTKYTYFFNQYVFNEKYSRFYFPVIVNLEKSFID